MPRDSIPSRLVDALIQSFSPTVKELATHVILGVAAVVWAFRNHQSKEAAGILVPLCWLICVEVVWHIIKAALSLSRDMPAVSRSSTIVSGTGKPIELPGEPTRFYRTKVWAGTSILAAACVFITALISSQLSHRFPTPEPTPAANNPQPAVEIFAECGIVGVPLSIPPQSSIHVLALNKKFMLSQHWGLADIPNRTDKSIPWPSNEIMRLEKQKHKMDKTYMNPGVFGQKCDVSNHGQVNVLDVAVTMTFWYDKQVGADNIKYTAVLSPIDAGDHFIFYIFNDCPVGVAGILPDSVNVTADGRRMSVPFNLPHRIPIEPIMMFFPSQTQWVRQTPCS